MNEKLTLQDLVDLLAKKAKITKKEADLFFRELFQLILDQIFDNDQVKIKDFGTFKLVLVNSRESVNVNTGEKIEIPAHHKLSFIPDKALRNLVNKPFAQFETILLEDGVMFNDSIDSDPSLSDDDEQAEHPVANNKKEVLPKDSPSEPKIKIPAPVDREESREDTNVKDQIKEPKASEISEDKKESEKSTLVLPRYTQPFVYTYTSSSAPQASSETVDNTILISLPKDVVGQSVDNPLIGNEQPETYKEDLPDTTTDENSRTVNVANKEQDITSSLAEDDSLVMPLKGVSDYYIEPIKPLESTPVHPKTKAEESLLTEDEDDDIEDLVDDDDDFDLETEIEIEDDSFQISEEENKSLNPNLQDIEKGSARVEAQQEKQKDFFSLDDPERPLMPFDDVVDDESVVFEPANRVTKKEAEPVVLPEPKPKVEVNPPLNRSVTYSDNVEELDFPIYDYEEARKKSNLRQKTFITVAIIGIVAFAGYNFYKLFTSNPEPKIYTPRNELTLMDSMIFMPESDASVEGSITDSIKYVAEESVVDTNAGEKENISVSVSQNEKAAETSNVAETGDTADNIPPKRLFSEHLQIGVINKGADHIAKFPRGKSTVTESVTADRNVSANQNSQKKTSKSKYVTFRRGNTLMTLAATYYGNKAFWVYIYQANRGKIRNPNDVPIGMSVLIPDLTDYGVYNTRDYNAISKAKDLEANILRRHR